RKNIGPLGQDVPASDNNFGIVRMYLCPLHIGVTCPSSLGKRHIVGRAGFDRIGQIWSVFDVQLTDGMSAGPLASVDFGIELVTSSSWGERCLLQSQTSRSRQKIYRPVNTCVVVIVVVEERGSARVEASMSPVDIRENSSSLSYQVDEE